MTAVGYETDNNVDRPDRLPIGRCCQMLLPEAVVREYLLPQG